MTEYAYHSVLDNVCKQLVFISIFHRPQRLEGEDKVIWGKKPFHQTLTVIDVITCTVFFQFQRSILITTLCFSQPYLCACYLGAEATLYAPTCI